MKQLLVFAVFVVFSVADARLYRCIDIEPSHNTAFLDINGIEDISWSEPWHSAYSNGKFIGLESAQYSKTKGYYKFHLTSFYTTEDSMHVLAVEGLTQPVISVVSYFDNDDYQEGVERYLCILD